MNRISLTSSRFTNCIVLPNIFIDEYMPSANGSYVKVYLYLVRCMQNLQSDITITAIADRLDNTENDILRALSYWEKVGLLSLGRSEGNQITSITLTDLSNPTTATTAFETSATDETKTAIRNPEVANSDDAIEDKAIIQDYSKPHYTETQIKQITSDDEVKWMMNIIEVYLDRPLRTTDFQLIMWLYESLNFSKELIMYLYEYCISVGKRNVSYLETVAISWHKEGIDTVEKAEATIFPYNEDYSAICKAFGLSRNPGAIEHQLMDKWIKEYKLPIQIIVEACNRTLLKTGKPYFEYADKILESWADKKVRTIKDIEKLDAEFKKVSADKATAAQAKKSNAGKTSTNKFNAFPQREYSASDYSDLEQKLMNLDYFTKND